MEVDFQDGNCDVIFPIRTMLDIFYLKVIPMFLSSFESIGPSINMIKEIISK